VLSGVIEVRPKVLRCFHHLVETERREIVTGDGVFRFERREGG